MKKLHILVFIFLLISCGTEQNLQTDKTPTAEVRTEGIQIRYMDRSVRPQDDFYLYVNGAWMQNAGIPADRSRWGSFDELRKQTDLNLLAILEDALKNQTYTEGTDQAKALAYFESYLDTSRRKKLGVRPLIKYLDKIQAVNSKQALTDLLIEFEPYFSSTFFGIYVGADMKNSKMNALYVYPSGGGLPERDYYLNPSEESRKIREAYQKHIVRMLGFVGIDKETAEKKARHILKLETAFARNKMTKEERRKPENRYNPVSREQFSDLLPVFDTDKYFSNLQLQTERLIITDLNYFKNLSQIIDTSDLEDLKDLMAWNVIRSSAGSLAPEMARAHWEFYGKFLEGKKERRPLKERALAAVNGAMGEAVGKIYVDRLFPPEAKQKAVEMVKYLQKAYIKRIEDLEWMTDSTKALAVEKVKTLTVKIGYPDKWKDYSAMEIRPVDRGGNYFENALAADKWSFDRMVSKLNRPVDKTEWGMSPQTVNAYYNPLNNEIVFPAAILQPPFFNFKADEAVNYGGMGAVIGHEISHGFDDQGAKFDVDGNFNNWWRPEDFKRFNEKVEKLARQYDRIEVLPGVYVNGTFTSGENIADLGGINAAYTALQMFYADHGKPGKIQGFTPEQRFFISWATVWRTKIRPEALKKQIKTDPHAPGRVRAVQPLRNTEAFHRAFDIQPGDKMYLSPEDRVIIW